MFMQDIIFGMFTLSGSTLQDIKKVTQLKYGGRRRHTI
jgi:hypothetical protein